MRSVLITAFEPYDRWQSNASWLALVELAKSLPARPRVTTRLYPVDVTGVRGRLATDLGGEFDVALHLGQAPGASGVRLEMIGLNVVANSNSPAEDCGPICDDGPAAYRSKLPLRDIAGRLRAEGIPTQISFHAGTNVCNATLYMSHYLIEQKGLRTQAALIHLPLEPSQVLASGEELPSLPAERSAAAVRIILEQLAPS